ncbi:hypothetical protein LEMLEM_LOCUS17050, partial [Lemmus lemmus]
RIGVPSLPALPSTKRLPIKRDLGRIFVCGSFSCGTGARHNWCRNPGRWVSLGTERWEHLRFRTRHVGAVTSVGSRNTGLGSESSDQDSGKSRGPWG